MAAPADKMKKDHTFRKYQDGTHQWNDFHQQIFTADETDKCPTYVHKTPPCQGSCPSGEDIRGWLSIARGTEKPPKDMTWQEYAFRRSTDANPFPSIMGRVCPAPCQQGCNRNQVEDYVGINAVEQYLGDNAITQKFTFTKPTTETGKRVAVIGGGPAGLAGAYQLRRMGHSVTLYEENTELGGMMRYGIPGYRTPRNVLDAEIGRIVDLGVTVHTKTRVGRDITLEQLAKDFDAVLWAIGAQNGRPLPVPGADARNCVSGVAFLKAFNEGRLKGVTGSVVCVGGGDTSIDVTSVARRLGHITNFNDSDRAENVVLGFTAHDVAETARREGATVTLTSLFPIENMTAAQHEVHDALREGVTIMGSVMPIEVLKHANGMARALRCVKVNIVKGQPQKIEGSEFDIEADLIVSAIGQGGDLAVGLTTLDNGRGLINSDKLYQVPGKAGHFVCGDIVRPHLLTTAIGQASIAAKGINNYLKGVELSKRPKVDVHHFSLLDKLRETNLTPQSYDMAQAGDLRGTSPGGSKTTSTEGFAIHNYEDRSPNEIIPSTELYLGHFAFTPRNLRNEQVPSAEEVLGHFEERVIGLNEAQTVAEAKRCMSCGMCFECDNCVIFCPQTAVKRVPKTKATMGRYVYTDYDLCIGCHICADVCPTGYIKMGLGDH